MKENPHHDSEMVRQLSLNFGKAVKTKTPPYRTVEKLYAKHMGREERLSQRGRKALAARWEELCTKKDLLGIMLTEEEMSLAAEDRALLWIERFFIRASGTFARNRSINWLFTKRNFYDLTYRVLTRSNNIKKDLKKLLKAMLEENLEEL